MRWFQAVAAEFGRYASWPLVSLSLDQLMAAYESRQNRDACDLSYTLDVDTVTGAVNSVGVSSAAAGQGSCSAPLMTAAAPVDNTTALQAVTVHIPLRKGGSATVQLEGLMWAPAAPAVIV